MLLQPEAILEGRCTKTSANVLTTSEGAGAAMRESGGQEPV